ncbi:MAG TPA: hypothetical protein DEQ34_11635 [Balneolaceae bacterium]|nr:hypothetical protein [Balneolaceae bacterium]|tara:strand:+ start:10087 stop:11343 length:1257 start_codon:yes stop_codon:yes gene_type:complete
MVRRSLHITLLLLSFLIVEVEAGLCQTNTDLYVFGFSQTIFNHKDISTFTYKDLDLGVPTDLYQPFKSNSFALHQLDLFFRKPINEKTVFFLNLSATGSYSSALNSGNFKINEGWVSYQITPNITGKVGLMVPTFNNLNEIKNRLPLFPYLIRPAVYEALLYGIFDEQDYMPQSSYIQINGVKNISNSLILDYSVNMGNSEADYASEIEPGTGPISVEQESATIYKGENLSTLLSYGGRIGVRSAYDSFKFGVSATADHDNRNEIDGYSIGRYPNAQIPVFGDVPRYRLGSDFSFGVKKLQFESELVLILHDHSEIHTTPQYKNANLNKLFAYALSTYNISERYYIFGGVNFINDQSYEFLIENSPDKAGLTYLTAGAGWKPFEDIVFKFQYSDVSIGENTHLDINVNFLTAGLSVIF